MFWGKNMLIHYSFSIIVCIFREATKCTKALVNTFVTTFGVADGMHKSIVNSEVKLDDLFN